MAEGMNPRSETESGTGSGAESGLEPGQGPEVESALVEAVARRLLSQLAPEETPLFPALSRAYFAQPSPPAAGADEGQESLLGFGAAIPTTLITPVLLAVSARVLTFVGAQLSKGLEAESAPLVRAALRGVFQRFLPPGDAGTAAGTASAATSESGAKPAPLTRDQLGEVRDVALAEARRHRLPKAQAERLVDALVAELAVD